MTAHPPPGTYLVTCPHCGERRVDTAKQLWVLRGFVLAARYGTVTVVGCAECVREQCRNELLTNLVAGWWSIWGLIGTPFVLLQNFVETVTASSPDVLEGALRKAGVDPDEVRVDARGFSGEQRRMLDAAYAVLGHSILADGRIDARELDLACAIISQLTDHRIPRDEIIDALLLADPNTIQYDKLAAAYRVALVRMAFDLAKSDGITSAEELRFLRRVAEMLGVAEDVLEDIILEAGDRGSAGPRPRQSAGDLERALACLEVSDATDIFAIKAAYRRQMLRYHPDRAGGDRQQQARHHRKAQEINWAYDYLLRRAGVR